MLLRRIVVLVTAGLAMAAMMALGAGAALADKGGGGHTECDDNTGICQFSGGSGSREEGGGGGNAFVGGGETSISGGGGSREGGGGGHFHVQGPGEAQQITSSGGSGGKDGGGGGKCEGEYNGYTDTQIITEERGSSAPFPCNLT